MLMLIFPSKIWAKKYTSNIAKYGNCFGKHIPEGYRKALEVFLRVGMEKNEKKIVFSK